MEFRQLGRSGLRISELSFGCGTAFLDASKIELGRKLIRQAFEQGVNFFDTAESYAQGQAEVFLGQALHGLRREDLVVSTKLFNGGDGPNQSGLSRKHLIEGAKMSLKRLQLEYVDILFCHRVDPNTPLEETVRAMDFLVRQGYTYYWGTSEWPASLLRETLRICKDLSCIAPSVEQPQYSLLDRRRFEEQCMPLYKEYGLGMATWGALACGVLAGRYRDGIAEDSRLAKSPKLQSKLTPQSARGVEALHNLAREFSCSPAQLALSWCLSNSCVSSVILGVSSEEQLVECLNTSQVMKKLPQDYRTRVDQLFTAN